MNKIHFLPLNAHGYYDIISNDVYLSCKVDPPTCLTTLAHELAHAVSKEQSHGNEWFDKYASITLALGCVNFGHMTVTYDHLLYEDNRPWLANVGQVTGIYQLLTDYSMLQMYRKFSQRILGTEGQWEFIVRDRTIRLFPVPKSSFPVIIEYLPTVTAFSSPQAREVTYRACLAQMKIALGHARRKFGGIPGPDGGSITLDGDALIKEGKEEYNNVVKEAIDLGEPMAFFQW